MRGLVGEQQTGLTAPSSCTRKPGFASLPGSVWLLEWQGCGGADGAEEEPGAGAPPRQGLCFFPSRHLPARISQAAASPRPTVFPLRGARGEVLHAQQVFPAASSKQGNTRKTIRFSPSLKPLNISP